MNNDKKKEDTPEIEVYETSPTGFWAKK